MRIMMQLRSWLAPPVFSAAVEKTRIAGVLHPISIAHGGS
jgi:hypothetical protein